MGTKNLMEKVLSNDNLNLAFRNVKANKGIGGVDNKTIEETKLYIKEHKEEIIEKLRTRKYKPSPVLRVEIPKDDGSKRKLGIPTILDRVIQQALVQILSPIFEENFDDSSYGFRPNRSCEMAIIRTLELFNDGYDYVVDIDLEKFFDNVPHDKLLRLFSNVIKDGDVVSLVYKFLRSGVMNQGQLEETKKGTPQGGPLSPLLSNIMLNELDKELRARGLNFVRYADDCIILVRSEKAANRVMESIVDFIERKLGLKVNATKSKVCRPNGLKYLGYGFYHKDKWRPKPHLKSMKKFKKAIKHITKRGIKLGKVVENLNYLIRGWINYFRLADMKKFLTRCDERIRTRLRVLIWVQWKNFKTRITNLVKLGIPKEEAKGLTYCRKGYQFIAHSCVVMRALSQKRFETENKSKGRKPLVSCLAYYSKVHI